MSTPSPPIRLFPLPDLAIDEPEPPPMSYGRRLTARNKRLIARGWHPSTHQRLLVVSQPDCEATCGGCAHAVPTGKSVKVFWKCARNVRGLTHGARTDIRLKWPACELFEPKPPVAPDEGTAVPSGDDRPRDPADGARCPGCGEEVDAVDPG